MDGKRSSADCMTPEETPEWKMLVMNTFNKSRSFFQISSGNKSRFVMHDLVSHFAVEVSGRYCCRLEDLSPSVSERTRYLLLLSVK